MAIGALPATLVAAWVVAIVSYLYCDVEGLPIKRQANSNMTVEEVMTMLYTYGYIQTKEGGLIGSVTDPKTAMAEGLKIYQKVWGLKQSGELDDETVVLLNTPRCGNPDTHLMLKAQGITKRYDLGTPYQKTHLTYNVSDYSNQLSKGDVDEAVQRAFQTWSNASDVLTFERDAINPDIPIGFYKGDHGDGYPFNGPGGVLAHAFPPPGSDTHMDEDETWYYREGTYGISSLYVFIHEFGHALGLYHSDVSDSIMAAYYRNAAPVLHQDDIDGIRALYDDRVPKTTTTPEPEPSHEEWCREPSVDAALYTSLESVGTLMLFRGDEVLAYNSKGKTDNYPMKIIDHFKNLEYTESYDAAFRIRVGYKCGSRICGVSDYYFFKDDMVTLWHLQTQVYKAKISEKFPGIPDNICAVFVRFVPRSAHIYFIKGNQVFVYEYKKGVMEGYPKELSEVFNGYTKIDAAISYRIKAARTIVPVTFVMKGSQYAAYMYDRKDPPASSEPKYPRPTAPWLLGCKATVAALTDGDPGLGSSDHLAKLYSWEFENAGLSMENDDPEDMLDVDGKPVDPAGAPLKLLDDDDTEEEIEETVQTPQVANDTETNNSTATSPGAESSAPVLTACLWLFAVVFLILLTRP